MEWRKRREPDEPMWKTKEWEGITFGEVECRG